MVTHDQRITLHYTRYNKCRDFILVNGCHNQVILFYFFQFGNVATLVIIHKRDLATFGYRPAMNENRNSLKSLYILVTCLNNV